MVDWPRNPRIYEINTWVWLTALTQVYGYEVTLANVPQVEVERLASYHLDAVWLMGVWHRGAATRASALNYIHEYTGALPDITEDDVAGSAYAIGAYDVEETLGGRAGLAIFRQQLRERGLKLILDFVPNHTGLDHPWLCEHPEYYVQAPEDWYNKTEREFFPVEDDEGIENFIAHGRDPYFPGWIDTAQLNALGDEYRQAAVDTLCDIASMADGVRCDMAMLMMSDVFIRTWGWLGYTDRPECDFWQVVIPRVRQVHSEFVFIAEAYWNMNYALLSQGFDYTYDKTLYDRILEADVNGIYAHLSAEQKYLEKQIRFIENHDELRAAATLGHERSRAAAVLICTLPGATLLHDGQFSGRTVKLPVHITRQPFEHEHMPLKQFYKRLLEEADDVIYHSGRWSLFECHTACEGCQGERNLVVYGWHLGEESRLIVLNLTAHWSQAVVDLRDWSDILQGRDWVLLDVLHRTYYEEDGQIMAGEGLRVDLEPHQALIYHLTPIQKHKRHPQPVMSYSG